MSNNSRIITRNSRDVIQKRLQCYEITVAVDDDVTDVCPVASERSKCVVRVDNVGVCAVDEIGEILCCMASARRGAGIDSRVSGFITIEGVM